MVISQDLLYRFEVPN